MLERRNQIDPDSSGFCFSRINIKFELGQSHRVNQKMMERTRMKLDSKEEEIDDS